MGLPLGAGGALTGVTMQGLATWDGGAWSTVAVAGSFVATALQFLNGSQTWLTGTGAPGGGFNITTPTAAQLIAQWATAYGVPPAVGQTWTFEFINQTNQTGTLVAGAGVTINGTATVLTNATRTWFCTVTNNSAAQAAVTVQNIASRTGT